MTDWPGRALEALAIIVSIILWQIKSRKADKKEADQRHEDNTTKLNLLISERVYLKPHDHIETDGPLSAEGIIRRRNGNS